MHDREPDSILICARPLAVAIHGYRTNKRDADDLRAITLLMRGKYEEAASIFHQEKALNQTLADACNNFAILLAASDRVEQAEDTYRQALSLNPDFADAHCNFAYLLYEHMRSDEAVDHFRKTLVVEPSHFDALIGLAHALAESGKNAESAEALKNALDMQPSDAGLVDEARMRVGLVWAGNPQHKNDGSRDGQADLGPGCARL